MNHRGIFRLLFICVFLVNIPISVFAWGGKVHREVALDAWYYMEHSALATQRQRDAIQWFFNNFGIPNPWVKVGEGTTWPDKVEHVCFCGDSWVEPGHYQSVLGHNFNSWYHFLDMYSAYVDYPHSRHSNCRNFASPDYKGEHNSWDGYNYRRHDELIADYDSDDVDSWAAWYIDDDNFCTTHTKTGLKWYEKFQGAKGINGLLIGPNNHSCYTRWDEDYLFSNECPGADFWNIIFAPIDNVGRAYYQMGLGFRNYLLNQGSYYCYYEGVPAAGNETFYKEKALFYLGATLHVADASSFHHIFNSSGWGHSEFESWASNWYSDQQWFQNKHQEIRDYINSYYTQNGVDPVNRPIRWLVHRLAWVVFNNDSMDAVWDRYVDEDDNDQAYRNYCLEAYPATVALAVIIMEKFYLGKEEVFNQQVFNHPNSENTAVVSSNPSVKVRVKKFKLVDETNPEWPGSDEIYGYFSVEDGIQAVSDFRIPSSGHYSMDEGDTRNLNQVIFNAAHVGDYLKIKARIKEADVGADDLVGEGNLQFTPAQNWGKGETHKIQCKYPDSDGHLDVDIQIE